MSVYDRTVAGEGGIGESPGLEWRLWPRSSHSLTAVVFGLVCLGLVMVASASGGRGAGGAQFQAALMRRALWICIGTVAFLVGSEVNYQFWRRHALAILVLALLGLVLVLVPGIGTKVNGARRWIRLGPLVGVQPSEFAKVGLCIWLAAYAERNAERMREFFQGFLLPFGVLGLAALLVLAEPDFGTAVLTGLIGALVLVVCGSRLLYVTCAGAAMLPLMHRLILAAPYRRARIMVFLDPWRDPMGAGYQLIQSKIATGSGGAFGLGLGSGMQKEGFLPGATNDFIFSTIAEELGFIGAAAVIVAFLWLVYEGFRAAMRARERFGFGLAVGLTALIGLQAAINVAVVTGSVPTKGLSLPFVSAGGSSLFFSMFAAGVLVNIARSSEAPCGFTLKPWYRDVPAYEHILMDVVGWVNGAAKRRDPFARRWHQA